MGVKSLKHFVYLCGVVSCLLLPLNCSDSSSSNPKPVSPYAEAAKQAYDKLLQMWLHQENVYKAMWYRGNALDTLIDYVVVSNDAARGKELGGHIPEIWNGGENGNWFDDFGWWGISFINAARHYSVLGQDGPGYYLDGARTALNHMEAAPEVWDVASQKLETCPKWAEYAPRFTGGIWNCDFGTSECPAPEGHPSCDPSSFGLCPIQNTVTNGLYLVLNVRYHNQTADGEKWSAVEKEYGFMKDWLSLPDIPEKCEGYPDVLPSLRDSDTGLIRERVGTYAEYAGCYNRVNGYEESVAWAGDQGIILGAVTDLINTAEVPDEDKEGFLYEMALSILAGVETTLTMKKGESDSLPEGVLRPWTNFNGWASFHLDAGDDYRTGPGVFMRYLLYAYKNSAVLREYISSPRSGYTQFLQNNADAMIEGTYDCDCLFASPEKWNACNLACQTNRLATLIAAMVVLEQ